MDCIYWQMLYLVNLLLMSFGCCHVFLQTHILHLVFSILQTIAKAIIANTLGVQEVGNASLPDGQLTNRSHSDSYSRRSEASGR